MELQIIQPQVPAVVWENFENLKAEITAKVSDYTTAVYTAENIKEAKEDRASLNKLANALDDERKRVKAVYEAPIKAFEAQVKEITGIIKNASSSIDRQIKECEDAKKAEKRAQIEELFVSIGFQPFVKLEMIWDDKWLNATVSMARIEEQMRQKMYQIGNDVLAIRALPEFAFEAMEVYKDTLDLPKAIAEGNRLADIARRKAEYEAEKAERVAKEQRLAEQIQNEIVQPQMAESVQQSVLEPAAEPVKEWVAFKCLLSVEDAQALAEFFRGRNIAFEQI